MESSSPLGRCKRCGGIAVGGVCLSCTPSIFDDVDRMIDTETGKKPMTAQGETIHDAASTTKKPTSIKLKVNVGKIDVGKIDVRF